jgi:hypothetical protein
MTMQPGDLILEIIGKPQTPFCIPGTQETQIWSDARIGDASLHIRLEQNTLVSQVLEFLRSKGFTPIGARTI